MAMSAREVIEIIFIPIYFILFLVALYTFVRHAHNKRITFGLLFLFPLIRCVGNILLVVAYQDLNKPSVSVNTLQGLFTAGFVLELAGFGILLGAGLNLFKRATLYSNQNQDGQQPQEPTFKGPLGFVLSSPFRLLQLINTVGSILLIVGISNSTSAFSFNSNGQSISVLAKVGCILLLVVIGILFLLTMYHLFIKGPITPSARTILLFVAVACVPMVARMAWSTYKVSSSDLANVNVWGQLVMQYFMECLATTIFIALSFVLEKNGGDSDLDERKSYNDRAATTSNANNLESQSTNHTLPQFSPPEYKENQKSDY